MIVTIDVFLKPESALQLVARYTCNGDLPRTKHDFDIALKTAARQTFQDGFDEIDGPRGFNDSFVDLRKRIELLSRSARKGGWLT